MKIGNMTGPPLFTGDASSDYGDVTLIAPTAKMRFPGIANGMQGRHSSTVVYEAERGAHESISAADEGLPS